ncbi:ligand-binding sensor domain-containing diguanylate cyclase [Luteimonas sp. MC1750]|nr:ligand-binding sensor domain-containing diguanylate cyclase [Luteimonas sp. MC1750]MBJ6985189.1 diguanylate cyclase [Luteimonas sp. MC1750]QQO05841.1 diguanylate cyclase [Luteimonas sp. MC1750]
MCAGVAPRLRRAWAVLLACALLSPAGAALALDPGLPPERYTVTRWSADDGLPHSQVHDIVQTDDGFLWIATWEGTVRFDGRQFREVEALNHAEGRRLPSRLFWRDADGSFLAAVDHLGLRRVLADGAVRPACTGFPRLDAMRVAAGRDGRAWVAARDGLYRVGGEGDCIRVEGGASLVAQPVLALVAHPDGSLWVGNRRGLHRWNGGELEPLGERLGLPRGEVRVLETTREGDIWVGGDAGAWRYRQGRLERHRSERVEGLLEDRQGAVWVAATESRMLRFWKGRWQALDARHGVEGYATGALYEGREGLVWFGTTHGLFRVSDGPVWGVGRQHGLPTDYIRSLLQTRDGQVWIGHSGGLSRMRGADIEEVYPKQGQPRGSVLSLARAADGGVWAGTYNRGVLHVGAGPAAPVRALGGVDGRLATEQVRVLAEDAQGTLWIGTERGLMAWRRGVLEVEPLPGLPALPVRALHWTGNGRMWVGFLGGLARVEPDGRVEVLQAERDYPALSALDFLPASGGGLWIASDRGLLRHDAAGFRLYGREQGLSGSTVFRILGDDFDNLWISGNDGVTRIPLAAFDAVDQGRSARLDLQGFTRDDGMPSRQANGGSAPAGWRMHDGELWLPTARGIAVFDPRRVMDALDGVVSLVVDDLVVDGAPLAPGQLQALPAGARLGIGFTGISLRNPGGLRYRYRMHGLDAGWIEAAHAGEVTYTNLPPGPLGFELQVARAPVDWSRPAGTARLELEVAAPWWSRPDARAAMVAGLLLLFAGIHQWLGRHQRARQRRLETRVAQRTEELREKNRQLEDASRQRELLMEQLAHQASHDPLTGLPNRRASDQDLAAAIGQSEAGGAPMCVAIIDIDRFKDINDRHGHLAGDRVLARVAGQLHASLQYPAAFIGRTGGEEFTVVIRGTRLQDAVLRLERARRDVAALRIAPDGEVLACTISIGVAERARGEGADALLRRADRALYDAKQRGRDRVVAV